MGTFARPPRSADGNPQQRYDYIRRQGRLLPGLQWKLIDDAGAVVPHNGVDRGELLMRGPWVAERYFRDEHPEHSSTAGCAPATSPPSMPGVT